MHVSIGGAGWSSPVARQAHNLKVVGSNPTPATKLKHKIQQLNEKPRSRDWGFCSFRNMPVRRCVGHYRIVRSNFYAFRLQPTCKGSQLAINSERPQRRFDFLTNYKNHFDLHFQLS